MAITNLTNTTWMFNEFLEGASYNAESYNVNFISNGETFALLDKESYRGYIPFYYDTTNVFNGSWTNKAYRTITITGGDDVENADLIALLKTSARQIQKIESFNETKTALKIYEDLYEEEYNFLEKEPNSFYLVNGVGVYQGDKLVAGNVSSKMLQEAIDSAITGALLEDY